MRTLESELATTPTDRLLDINLFDLGTADTSFAYHVAKRGVHVRVAAAALAWGERVPGSTRSAPASSGPR